MGQGQGRIVEREWGVRHCELAHSEACLQPPKHCDTAQKGGP